MKLLTIIGARPQFIKAAVVSRAIKHFPEIQETIVHTGQHFDPNMSDIFFNEMDIPQPDVNLDIHSLNHGAMTGRMLEQLEQVMLERKPDAVMVYGDTNSTLAGALAAAKLGIRIAHVEAGLRSFNMSMPEEINRILTDRMSHWLFCPTDVALTNLENEGYAQFSVQITKSGDVMEDAALYYANKINDQSSDVADWIQQHPKFILATLHRSENTDNQETVSRLIQTLNKLNDEIQVVMPIHPRTRKIVHDLNLDIQFQLLPPVGYLDMIRLLQHSSMVITDSGGLQKESYFFSKYCITIRTETEWTELVSNGYNVIAGSDPAKIMASVAEFMHKPFPEKKNLYGNGQAAAAICRQLIS